MDIYKAARPAGGEYRVYYGWGSTENAPIEVTYRGERHDHGQLGDWYAAERRSLGQRRAFLRTVVAC